MNEMTRRRIVQGRPLFQLHDVRDLRLGRTRGFPDTNLEHADAQTLG